MSVIAPAYDCYASRWGSLPALLEFNVPLGHEIARLRVRFVVQRGVSIYLLECPGRFVTPYPAGDATARLSPAVLLARGSLVLLERLATLRRQPPPDAIISNDWVAALVAPYARHTAWAGAAAASIGHLSRNCLFVHLVHNLEVSDAARARRHPGQHPRRHPRQHPHLTSTLTSTLASNITFTFTRPPRSPSHAPLASLCSPLKSHAPFQSRGARRLVTTGACLPLAATSTPNSRRP